MSSSQVTKGKQGEQELCRLLSEHLGVTIRRSVRQDKDSADLPAIGPWLVEVKRAKEPAIAAWYAQACRAAELAQKFPVLAYRLDRHPWKFVIPMRHLAVEYSNQPIGLFVTLGLDEAMLVLREAITLE